MYWMWRCRNGWITFEPETPLWFWEVQLNTEIKDFNESCLELPSEIDGVWHTVAVLDPGTVFTMKTKEVDNENNQSTT